MNGNCVANDSAESVISHNGSELPSWFPVKPFPARLISNNRVTAENHFQDTRLIRLDINGSNIR